MFAAYIFHFLYYFLIMLLETITNQYDSVMRGVEIDEKVMNNVINLIKNPLIVSDKSKIPQWKFCTVSDSKRCTESIKTTNILILDFDDSNFTYQEFENRFRAFKYYLHTSYSYDGKNSKFRVLLFLDKEYEVGKLFLKCHDIAFSPYHKLLNYFPHVDPASFVRAQFFKMPALKMRSNPYYYNIHDGKLFNPEAEIEGFSFAMLLGEQKQEEYYRRLEMERNKKFPDAANQDRSRAIDYIKRKFEQMPEGQRHMGIFSLANFFAGIGGSWEEFSQIPKPSWADKGFHNQIKRLRKEWNMLGRR